MPHFMITQPFERKCVCTDEGERAANGHTQECNDKQRVDFFGATYKALASARASTYGTPDRTN